MRTVKFAQLSQFLWVRAVREASGPQTSVLHHPKLIPAIVAAIIAATLAWIAAALSRWRRITWREHMDAPISLAPKAAQWNGVRAAWKVVTYHGEIEDPSLVLLRVKNSGFRSVGADDIRRPMTFTFPGREVKELSVTGCRGMDGEMNKATGTSGATVAENRITLPRFGMRRGASFKLLVLLSGSNRGVHGKGYIRHGRMIRESRGRSPLARNITFGAVVALLVGIQSGVTFSQAATVPSFCRSGRLVLEGSTAFAPVARQVSEAYTSSCHGAEISVTGISTFSGLNAVNNAGPGRGDAAEQIAMSDGPAPGGYPGLTGHPVGVIIFAIVVSRQAAVFNLSTADLRGIFQGTITNWRQVGGADLPVRIVARAATSGTRRTFDEKVLRNGTEPEFSSYDCISKNAVRNSPVIRCEVADTATLLQKVNNIPGAIGYAQISDAATYPNVERVKLNGADPDIGAVEQGAYPFWTVEYLYSYGQPAVGTLAAAFLGYLDTDTTRDVLLSAAYTPCINREQSLATTLCRG